MAGTGTHVDGSRLPDIPAVRATVTAVREALIQHCGMDGSQIRDVLDPEVPKAFLDAANAMAQQAEDVLLVYYIGHGLVNLTDRLFLATSETADHAEAMLPVEALPFDTLRDVLARSQARHVVLVLDCCFSGRASEVFGPAVADAFELANTDGGYLLSATSATEQALAPPGEEHTAFSGALLEFLRNGDPSAPRDLTLEDAYRYLARVLPRRDAPAPRRRLTGNAGGLVVAVNPRASQVTRPRSDPSDRAIAPVSSGPCPYPGLEAFTANEAAYFYGRERLIAGVLDDLAVPGREPLAIVGRSGAGKSSLLCAGVLPAIKDGRLNVEGSRHWRQVVMTPGEHPLERLTRRLSAGEAPEGLLVCVDQFEEVFTACADEGERRAFIRALCALPDGSPPAQVIIGLRADFYSHCLEFPELAAILEGRQVLMRPMSSAELTEAIEQPAATVGLRLEENLTGRLLRDLEPTGGPGREAGSTLPMLAFALQATWQESDKQVLTLSDYEATGGIWGAVTQRADGVFSELSKDGQNAARTLLLSLVHLGDGTDDVRRPVSIDSLIAGRLPAEQSALRTALDAYVGARLVTVDDGTAEITHEALLRAWPRLRDWIVEDREELLDRQRLAEAARLWKSGNGSPYTGARLAEARTWLAGKDTGTRRDLSLVEREFIREGTRVARRRRSYIATAIVAVFLLVLGGVYGFQQRAGNQASQAVRSSVQLAQEASDLRTTDPAGAMWLSLTAYHSSPTPQARTQLYDSLTTPYPLTLPGKGKGAVQDVAYSPGGATAAGVWNDGTVTVWRVSDPLRPVALATLHGRRGGISRLAFSPDGRLLAVHSLSSLRLWRVGPGPRPPALLSDTAISDGPASKAPLLPLAFSPDGKTVVTGEADGDFRLWSVTDPARPVLLSKVADSRRAVASAAFSPDGHTLAVASADAVSGQNGQVRLWDVRATSKPAAGVTLTVTSALTVAFSPVRHLLVAGGTGNYVHAWNVADMNRPVRVRVNDYSTGNTVWDVAFHPHGSEFVSANSKGMTNIWTGPSSAFGFDASEAGSLPDPAGPDSVAFSPDGTRILTGDVGGTAELWSSLAPVTEDGMQTWDHAGTAWSRAGTSVIAQRPDDGPTQLLDVSDPLRPRPAATLPGYWVDSIYTPGGDTLVTAGTGHEGTRLWDVSNPRHPREGAALPPTGSFVGWDASENGLLLVADNDSVRIWDIRNVSHPVLDSRIRTMPAGAVQFLSDQLVSVNVKNSGQTQLWDVTNPRHPVGVVELPISDHNASGTYSPSRQLLAESRDNQGGTADTTLWNLKDLRNPRRWNSDVDMDPSSISMLGDRTWIALTASDNAIALWDMSDPRSPRKLSAIPLGNASGSELAVTARSGGWLTGTSLITTGPAGTMTLADVTADGRALDNYAQIPGVGPDLEFSPNGKFLATDLDLETIGNGLGAFYLAGSISTWLVGILYPLDADSLYAQLCSDTVGEHPSASWRQYLPNTYYRPACS